jgi:glycosyltransferase involved in cell wall biosynthesis
MACGTPVVAGNTSSLPEVVGDAAVLIDPYDEQKIANALLRIVNDELLRLKLRKQGIEQVKKFTWRAAAEKTLQLYRESFAAKF